MGNEKLEVLLKISQRVVTLKKGRFFITLDNEDIPGLIKELEDMNALLNQGKTPKELLQAVLDNREN